MRRMLSACAAMTIVAGMYLAGWPMRAMADGFERIGPPCRTCDSGLPCLPTGAWNSTPWMTPTFPHVCQPLFASGVPIVLDAEVPVTVVRLKPIPTGKPKEPPPQRPITDPPVRPPRSRISIDDQPGDMPMTGNLSKLHVVLLTDNEAKDAGKAHAAGSELMIQLFKNGIRAERLGAIVRLDSTDLIPETINRKLQEVPVKPDDTLLVYYAGAAEFDAVTMSVTLTPSSGMTKLPRDDLKKQATAKGARLTILLTDPADKPALAEPSRKPETPDPGPAGLEKLFFSTQGIVDVHGCSAGEFAAARGNYGGCFTQAFVREFGRPAGSWADMLESVKFSTNNLFKSYRLEVLKSEDMPATAKTAYRNQESQFPAQMTPIDNLKPATPAGGAAPPLDGNLPARIFLRVPERAVVLIDGQPTTQTGAERGFETPPLPTTVVQSYDVRVEMNGWAGLYRIEVRGGATVMAELQVPETVVKK